MGEYHILNDDEFNARETRNSQPVNISNSPWHILEHLKVAQWDILEFIRNPAHESPQWPEGYWPDPAEESDQVQWDQTISSFLSDIQALRDIVADPDTDLYAPIPHSTD